MSEVDRAAVKSLIEAASALLEAMRLSGAGEQVWRFSSYREYMRKYNQLAEHALKVVSPPPLVDIYDLANVRGMHDTVASQQKQYFDSVYANLCVLRSLLEQVIGAKQEAATDLASFVETSLRRAVFDLPTTEKQVQDALETLFVGRGWQRSVDYERETGRVKVSIKESVPDFVVSTLDLAVEVKLVKDAARARSAVDEINADIRAYATRYSRQLFVIYDLGFIRDISEFKHGLESVPTLYVVIVKH